MQGAKVRKGLHDAYFEWQKCSFVEKTLLRKGRHVLRRISVQSVWVVKQAKNWSVVAYLVVIFLLPIFELCVGFEDEVVPHSVVEITSSVRLD